MKIRQKQKRRAKLAKLRKKYTEADFEGDKEKIWEKVLKIAPWLNKKEFLGVIKKSKTRKKEKKEEKGKVDK